MTHRQSAFITFLVFFASCLLTGQHLFASVTAPLPDISQHLTTLLTNKPTTTLKFYKLQASPQTIDSSLLTLYQKNDLRPYWITEFGPGQKAEALLSVLQAAEEEGLNPAQYQITTIQSLWQKKNPEELARLDIMLTLALETYVADMQAGRVVACRLDPKLFAAARDRDVDLIKIMNQALRAPDLVAFLQQQAPQHFGYQSLKKILIQYRTIKARGGWPSIAKGKVLKPTMPDNRLDALARRLIITNDLQSSYRPSGIYDEQLVTAVKHFQKRYNLEQDGVIGKKTLAALNIPVDDHIRRIIINMERWRWLPHTLNGQRLLVNIAGFRLTIIQDEQPKLFMPVIVGKERHKTPVFTHTMRYIVFNPYWNIPNSIARHEIVPHMIKDPLYLAKKHIRLFKGWQSHSREINPASIDWKHIGQNITQYRLRQDAGPDNALGTIKFIFPNKYNIYLHDTPSHNLFKMNKRSFSHGCIRVSDPQGLALYLLRHDDPSWTGKRIAAMVQSGQRKVVPLKHSFPVHILYRTVLVDPRDKTIYFYDDVYGRDTLLAQALFTGNQPAQCRYTLK